MSTRPPAQDSLRPLSFLVAAVWTLLVASLVGVLVTLTDAVRPGAYIDVVTVATSKVLAYSVVLFAILRVHEPESSIREVLGLRRVSLLILVLAALLGAGLALPTMWLEGVLAHRFPPEAAELEAIARIFDTPTLAKKIALVAATVVVMPVSDELFFRGALFTPLLRSQRIAAVVVATALYDTMLGGAQPRDVLTILTMVLTLGWLRATTQSVVPAVVARVAFFAVQVVPIVLTSREIALSPRLIVGGLGGAVAASALIAGLSRRNRSAEAEAPAD